MFVGAVAAAEGGVGEEVRPDRVVVGDAVADRRDPELVRFELVDDRAEGVGREDRDRDQQDQAEGSQFEQLAATEVGEDEADRDRRQDRALAVGRERRADQRRRSRSRRAPGRAPRVDCINPTIAIGSAIESIATTSRPCSAGPTTSLRPISSTPSAAAGGELEIAGQQLFRPAVEDVEVEAVLPEHPDRADHGEDEDEVEEGADLALADDAGDDEEDREVGAEERQLFHRQAELEGLVEVGGVEHDAEPGDGGEGGDRSMNRGEPPARRAAPADGEREAPS